jgi:hypothetical protein
MGSGKTRSTRAKRITIAASVLVTQMQKELDSLVARQRELTRRIRSVHRVVRGLREIATARAANPLHARPQPSTDDGTIASPCLSQTSGIGAAPVAVSIDLQRACRIALMEAETAVSLEEICERIVRRGSFSFGDTDHARLLLSRALNTMTKAGETRLLENGPSPHWERSSQATEYNEAFTSSPDHGFDQRAALLSGR